MYCAEPCMSEQWDNVRVFERGSSDLNKGGNVSVYLLFSADESSSMLIRALAPLPLMTSQVRGDVNSRPLTARHCHPSPPSIHTLSAVMSAHCGLHRRPRNWSHDYEFIWVFRSGGLPKCHCCWWRMDLLGWWYFCGNLWTSGSWVGRITGFEWVIRSYP